MSVPQRADKWLVFLLMLGASVAALLPLTGGPADLDSLIMGWLAVPAMFGLVGTACYVVWCMGCRTLARLLGIAPESAGVRFFANASFLALCALLLVAMFTPIKTHAVLIGLPHGAAFGTAAPARSESDA